MLTEDAKSCFGGAEKLTESLEFANSSRIYQWGPVVHESSAPKLHVLSKGRVKYVPEFYAAYKADPDNWESHAEKFLTPDKRYRGKRKAKAA